MTYSVIGILPMIGINQILDDGFVFLTELAAHYVTGL